MATSKDKKFKFIFTPALTPGQEDKFDADKTDLFIALNGRSDITASLVSSDQAKTDATVAEFAVQPIAARAHLIFAGYSQISFGGMRTACGIFEMGLVAAHRYGAKRVTVPISSNQFRGDLDKLAAVLRCRVDRFVENHPDTSLVEMEILCSKSDLAKIKSAMNPKGQLCDHCFHKKHDESE